MSPKGTRRRQVSGTPGVLPSASVAPPRRPLPITPSVAPARHLARRGPAWLATGAGTRRGATTTSALPATGPVAAGRPSHAAWPLPTAPTTTIAGGLGTDATPTYGVTTPGRPPFRATVVCMRPPAMVDQLSLLPVPRPAMAVPAASSLGVRSTDPPIRGPRAELPVPPATVAPWRRWS